MGDLIKPSAIMGYVNNGTIDPGVALEDLADEKAKWAAGDDRDQQVATAYAAIESGCQLVDIHTVLERGGYYEQNWLPRLALAPALAKEVRVKSQRDGRVRYSVPGSLLRRPWRFQCEMGGWSHDDLWHSGRSNLPIMPPAVREVARKEHLVVWETKWVRHQRRAARPPVHIDPALLEHVSGSLYVVIAAWELTELEAAALR